MDGVPTVALNNGVDMPQLGLGVARVPDGEAFTTVSAALEIGYRSVDTAKDYGNERGVGRALRQSRIPRAELFVTTKVWNADHGRSSTLRAFEASIDRLGLEYVDLYLIHWPVPTHDRYVETWYALEELYRQGLVRAIGVSNFEPAHLVRLLAEASTVPAVNQIELHPRLQQRELRALHAEHQILTQAWSPLAKGNLPDHPHLLHLAYKYGVSVAQVILRWHIQIGNIAIPKTVTPSRMQENLHAVHLPALSTRDLAVFDGLNDDGRIGPHPNEFS